VEAVGPSGSATPAAKATPKADNATLLQQGKKDNEFCGDDYPAGQQEKNDCTLSNHTNIKHKVTYVYNILSLNL
jgi:hypothetical protein